MSPQRGLWFLTLLNYIIIQLSLALALISLYISFIQANTQSVHFTLATVYISVDLDTDCVVYLHGDLTFLQVSWCSAKDSILLKVRMDVQTNVKCVWFMCMCMCCCSRQVHFEVHASAHVRLSLQVWCIYRICSIEYTSREAPFGEALDASTSVMPLITTMPPR